MARRESHEANINEFQSAILRPKGVIDGISFCVSGYTLQPVPFINLFGVKIADRLSFENQISSICNRVAQQTNALLCFVEYLSIENRTCIFATFLASLHLISVIITQSGIFSNRSLYQLEKAHKQALLHVVFNDHTSSYRYLLNTMARHTLDVTRLKAISTEAYESYANENPSNIYAMLNPPIKATSVTELKSDLSKYPMC